MTKPTRRKLRVRELKGASHIGHTPREYATLSAAAKVDREAENRARAAMRKAALEDTRSVEEIEDDGRAFRARVSEIVDALVYELVQAYTEAGIDSAAAAYLLEHGPITDEDRERLRLAPIEPLA